MLPVIETLPLQTLDGPFADELFLIARVLFGGIIAVMGLNHFLDLETTAGYAEMKGVPAPTLSVLLSGVVLVFGGLGIVLGLFPAIAAGALAGFLLVTTPLMHDFWAVPDDQQQSELTAFMKNVGLFAGTLVVLAVSALEWPYALGIGLF
ncbi:DoxX family protein [Natronorubrum sulfidifaciens]|uniref:DoxX family protein n=1 Tax=Natronorubrum sulfidifaciens JCM 14089 TaxID=1230460 RepID=L9WDD4_9EURY|nr:DoxX family protein [Natronorubrum sulfidifaciens]ELY46338.1 DoxX family protein [Natronorubrum sulfidifaciens JCM 14089]